MQEYLLYDTGRCCMLLIAVLAVIDGIVGFVKAGKPSSDSIGLPVGILLGFVFLFSLASTRNAPLIVGAWLCVPLCAVFCIRLKRTRKFIPSGAQLAVLTIGLIFIISGIFTNPWESH